MTLKHTELTHGEPVKLDHKDKKILEQLQLNARQSIASIAKKTKLPRDVVVYRVKKLEKNKVIRWHHTFLNPSRLGYPLYSYIYFACHNISVEEEEQFVKYLVAQNQIIYVCKSSGKFDFTIGVCAKDYKDFDTILQQVRRKFSHVIKDSEVTPVIQEYKYDWMVGLLE